MCGGPVGAEGPYCGGWRQHAHHATVRQVVAEILGEDVSADDVRDPDSPTGVVGLPIFAAHIIKAGRPGLLSEDRTPSPTDKPRKPWSWLTEEERAELEEHITARRVARTPMPNVDRLPCGWCGVREAREWTLPGSFKFSDGRAAPLCEACQRGYEAAGEPGSWDGRWRGPALSLAIGAKGWLLDGHGIRAYCELAREPYPGVDEPWDYIPPVTRRELEVRTFGPNPSRAKDPEAGRRAAETWQQRIAEEMEQRRQAQQADDGLVWTS